MEHILRLGRQYKPPKSTVLSIHLWNFQDIILTLSDLVYYKTFRWWRYTLSITILSAKMAIFTIVYQILTKAVVVLKDTRCTVNATCLSMVAKKNSLAFDLYPTFDILTTDMEKIRKTKVIIFLLDLWPLTSLGTCWSNHGSQTDSYAMETYGTINKLWNEVLHVRMR